MAAAAAAPAGVSEEDAVMLQILSDSWEECKGLKEADKKREEEKQRKEEMQSAISGRPQSAASNGSQKSGGMFGGLWGSKSGKSKNPKAGDGPGLKGGEEGNDDQSKNSNSNNGSAFDVPRTFDEMVKLNVAMTGANLSWIEIVLDSFDRMVGIACKGKSLEEEAHVMALRFNKDAKGEIHLQEFKVCMLASLRSLLPARWDMAHERAWMWFWEKAEQELRPCIPMPRKFEKPVDRFVQALQPDQRKEIGLAVWNRMFEKLPQAESFFKQSNQRLIYIVEMGLNFSAQMYQEPTMMVNKLTALGLKHIMWAVPPEYFETYVQSFMDVIAERCETESDMMACEGIGWSLCVIASIMARTVLEGSTPVLRAVVANDAKALRKELSGAPRGSRAKMMLHA